MNIDVFYEMIVENSVECLWNKVNIFNFQSIAEFRK